MIACLVPLVVLLGMFFVVPFGVMLYQSFFLSPLQAPGGLSPTLANYAKLFGDAFYLRVLLHTLLLGAGVTGLALVVGSAPGKGTHQPDLKLDVPKPVAIASPLARGIWLVVAFGVLFSPTVKLVRRINSAVTKRRSSGFTNRKCPRWFSR